MFWGEQTQNAKMPVTTSITLYSPQFSLRSEGAAQIRANDVTRHYFEEKSMIQMSPVVLDQVVIKNDGQLGGHEEKTIDFK